MEIITETPYGFLPFDCSPSPQLPALTLIVKGTFELRADEPAAPLDKGKQKQFAGDETFMDEIGRSLSYSNDLVPLKLRGEATVNAVCRPPHPTKVCDVAIEIGPIKKTLRVQGDRAWPDPAKSEPFASMPIRWERAFGGMSHLANPLGRGIEPWPTPAGPVHYLPNVEYPDERVANLVDRPRPAGFGPISPMWSPRLERQGTRDQRWAMFRAPLPPDDFDPRYYQGAPADQQLDHEIFFRGDEAIALTNLHPKMAAFRGALPGRRVRLFLLLRQPNGLPSVFTEVFMKLDTVHLDTEAETVTLVWRQPIKVKTRAHVEIEAVYIADEPLAEPAALAAVHEKRFLELRGPKLPPQDKVLQEEIDRQTAEAKKILRDGGVDPQVCDEIDKMKDPQQILDTIMKFVNRKTGELEKLTASFKAMG